MPSTAFRISLLLPLLLACASCRQPGDESFVVAQVYDRELHASALEGLVGEGVSADDSVAIVSNYVEQWIRQTVLLDKAERNVEADFSRQLEEYRASLVTYAYEQQMVEQLLDTNVSYSEVEAYYEAHGNEFVLHGSLVRALYVAAPKKSPLLAQLRRMVVDGSGFYAENAVEVELFAARNGLSTGHYAVDAWIPFDQVRADVPLAVGDEARYLKSHRTDVVHDDSLAYFVRFVEYRTAGDIPPLSLLSDRIKATILNGRKNAILAQLQSDLIDEAEKAGAVKRYVKTN